MAKSPSAIYFLVIIMAIIVCLSILVGTKSFASSGDDDLLRDAQQYASSFSGPEHYADADLDEEDGIEMEDDMEEAPEDSSADLDDSMEDVSVEEFRARRRKPVVVTKRPAALVPGESDVQAFDGVELQTFAPIAV